MSTRSNFVSAFVAALITFLAILADQALAQSEVTARVGSVSSFDGRYLGEDYTGTWVTVSQARVNGVTIARSTFSFELAGNYGRAVRNIGLSSIRTIPSLSPNVAARLNHPSLGDRYWIDENTIPNIRRMVQSLTRQDQEVVYVICSLMSQSELVASIIPRMIQDRRGDDGYATYWQEPARVREINRLGENCMRQMRRLVQFDAPQQVATSTQTAPAASSAVSTASSAVDQVRLAQTILAAMGLYTSSIDGVAGPGTNRALTAGMQQLNSTDPPTVENFLRVAVGRIRTVDRPAAAPSNAPQLAEIRSQNANLTSQLESARAEAAAAAAELLSAKNAMASLLIETSARNADGSTAQAEIAALEAQLAELSAAHEAEVSELTAALEQARTEMRGNDAANATIADLREELERLRPLTAQLVTLTEQNTSLQRQLSAANETVADLRDGIASDERVSELQRQLDAANATVASLRDEMTAAYVPVADYVALQRQIAALNANNTEMRDRIEADYVPRLEYAALEVSSREAQDALRGQLAAANQTVAELRERMNTAYVPVADHAELQRQLAAASATATELRETMRADYVPKSDFLEAQRILAATNESMADLRRSIETEYMPLEDYVRLERQVSALNSTILELQDRNEIQRNRMVESESLFRNFREDCAAVPECAQAMRLD